MHENTDIKERMYDLTEKERFNNIIIEFSFFAKKVLPQLKGMRKTISNFKETKSSQIGAYKALYTILDKYEELNLTAYNDGNDRKLVIGDPNNKDALKDQMQHMVENLKNPYEEMYHWIKGEMYDI